MLTPLGYARHAVGLTQLFLANDILILKIQPLYHTTMIDCGPYILMLILKQANGTLAATLKR